MRRPSPAPGETVTLQSYDLVGNLVHSDTMTIPEASPELLAAEIARIEASGQTVEELLAAGNGDSRSKRAFTCSHGRFWLIHTLRRSGFRSHFLRAGLVGGARCMCHVHIFLVGAGCSCDGARSCSWWVRRIDLAIACFVWWGVRMVSSDRAS